MAKKRQFHFFDLKRGGFMIYCVKEVHMEFMTFVTMICLQVAPGAKVSMDNCEAHYKACVEDLASNPQAKLKGLTHLKIAEALYEVPKSRINLCK